MILLDTSILVRLVNPADPQRPVARDAIERLAGQGEALVLAPQCLYELWVVATRPAEARGGLGRTIEETRADIDEFLQLFGTTDDGGLLGDWLDLVTSRRVSGRPAHDARLVALMLCRKIDRILTFNVTDFVRFPQITALHPANVQPSS